MKTNPVNWFEIYVQDMARAKRFYESVLKTKLEKLDSPELEMWSFPMDQDGQWRIVHDQNTALDYAAFARVAGIAVADSADSKLTPA